MAAPGPVRRFAERVLYGETLADKLAPPEPGDGPAGPPLLVIPSAPGRPAGLRFDDGRPKPPSPRRADLDRADGRGRVLHGFANHELLALELMALMLLRFPDAPEGWRKGLLVTLQDEQKHLKLYVERMRACGVELGEVPVSSFFWDVLAHVDSPLAFTAAMGLGFEQANLDFARHWGPAFRRAGDGATADVIDEVYVDEVRHLRHAVAWYPRLAGQPLSFAHWSAQLAFPMSVARAKGPHVDREGRRRAGLPDGYVRELEVAGASRGRPPRVFQFRAAVEEEVAGRPVSKAARAIQRDLQHLPLLVAHHEDVLVAEPAGVDFLQALRGAGIVPCEVVARPPDERAMGPLEPWGWSPAAAAELDPERDVSSWAAWWGKDRVVPWQQGLLGGQVATSLDALQLPDGPWVVKARHSASGMRRVRGQGALTEKQRGKVESWLEADGAVVVQRWLDRVVDLSVHGRIDDEGVHLDGIVRFETGPGGVFRGAFVGPWAHGLPSEVQRFLHTPRKHAARDALEAAWTELAEAAHGDGYRGPLGVDAMVARQGTELVLVPVVEANPRWTMGRIALLLRKRLSGRARGWWRFLPVRSLASPPAEWVAEQRAAHPLRFDGGRLLSGVVATNDPRMARQLLTVLELVPHLLRTHGQTRPTE